MAENFKIEGFAELQRKLAALPVKIEKNILRSMVRAGAQVVRKAAIENLGDAGDKKAVMVQASRRKSRGGKVVVDVGVSAAKWYLKFLERGTRPHTIRIKNRRILKTGGPNPGEGEFLGAEVSHPGHAPKPFLRPALDENVPAVIEAMRKQGEKRIEKEAAK